MSDKEARIKKELEKAVRHGHVSEEAARVIADKRRARESIDREKRGR